MPEPKDDAKEEIEIKVDGVKVKSFDDLPPELKPEVEKRIKEARESLTPKYAPGKLRMRINVKHKTSKAALAAAGTTGKPPAPAVVPDEGAGLWPVVLLLLLAAAGAAWWFFLRRG